ncbi:MAG: hypothetical protein EOO75_20735, partial [Myxococcales bacterium]
MEDASLRVSIAAPSSPLFAAAYASWATIVVALAVSPVLMGSRSGPKPSIVCFVLVPLALVWRSRWVGASTDLPTLLRRSIAVHAVSSVVAGVLMALGRASDPGASGQCDRPRPSPAGLSHP